MPQIFMNPGLSAESLPTVISLLDGRSRIIRAYVVNLKLIYGAVTPMRVF